MVTELISRAPLILPKTQILPKAELILPPWCVSLGIHKVALSGITVAMWIPCALCAFCVPFSSSSNEPYVVSAAQSDSQRSADFGKAHRTLRPHAWCSRLYGRADGGRSPRRFWCRHTA